MASHVHVLGRYVNVDVEIKDVEMYNAMDWLTVPRILNDTHMSTSVTPTYRSSKVSAPDLLECEWDPA